LGDQIKTTAKVSNVQVSIVYTCALQTSLSEGHISYYTTVRGPDILRNVIVSGHVIRAGFN